MTLLLQLLNKKKLCFILFLLYFSVSAQNVKNYTMTDGLPGNSIKCLFKDSKGLLWIATETGLCTFNGTEFKIIGKEQGLKYNLIWSIDEDNEKNIWLSVYGYGVAKYDGKKFVYFSEKNGLVNNKVRKLFFSKKQKCMVFGTEDGLSIFNGKKFKNFNFEAKNYNHKFQVNFISDYQNDIVFNLSYENIYKVKIDKNKIEKSTISILKNPNNQNYTGLIHENNYYGRNLQSQFEIQNLKTNKKVNFEKCSNIWDFTLGDNNTVYAACWDGNSPVGAILSYKNGVVTDVSKKLNLPSYQFWTLMYDKKTKQLWIGTVDQGIFIINLDEKIQIEKNNFGKFKPEVTTLFLDKNQNLWIGGNNFLLKKDKYNKTIRIDNNYLTNYLIKNTLHNKSSDLIRLNLLLKGQKTVVFQSIKEDFNGAIWVFTNVGLFCFDQNLKCTQYIYKHETTGVFDFISPNKLFFSHAYTLTYIVPTNNIEKIATLNYKGKPIRLDANKILKTKNKLWIASWSKGIYLFENGKLQSINILGSFSENNVVDIIEDENHNLIIGTVNGKVYFSKWNTKKLIHSKILYPDKDIIGNSIFFIRKYNEYLFIETNKGLNILKNFKLLKFINQDENLPQTSYTDACVDTINKKLILGTYKGIVTLNLDEILKSETSKSPIVLNHIKINDKLVPNTHELNLEYNQNTLEIQFGCNNLYNPKKNYFSYKIIGLTNKWTQLSTESSLKLFNIKSGEYLILIKGKNIGTNETFTPYSLKINISPPFWMSWWFVSTLIVALILALTYYLQQKFIRIKNKAKLDKRIAETKLQALQSQMNPHFVFNAMNSIQNFVIDNHTDEALWYIGEFSKLIRQTLEFSSKQWISVTDEISYLNRYIELENLRRTKKVKYSIFINQNNESQPIEIPPLLIQPIVENVFIHAFDKLTVNPKLTIHFTIKTNHLQCQITDNGKGFDSKKQLAQHSKGIQLVDERIQLLSGTTSKMIQIQPNSTSGTTIIMTIPMR
jgi:hypothetical protein